MRVKIQCDDGYESFLQIPDTLSFHEVVDEVITLRTTQTIHSLTTTNNQNQNINATNASSSSSYSSSNAAIAGAMGVIPPDLSFYSNLPPSSSFSIGIQFQSSMKSTTTSSSSSSSSSDGIVLSEIEFISSKFIIKDILKGHPGASGNPTGAKKTAGGEELLIIHIFGFKGIKQQQMVSHLYAFSSKLSLLNLSFMNAVEKYSSTFPQSLSSLQQLPQSQPQQLLLQQSQLTQPLDPFESSYLQTGFRTPGLRKSLGMTTTGGESRLSLLSTAGKTNNISNNNNNNLNDAPPLHNHDGSSSPMQLVSDRIHVFYQEILMLLDEILHRPDLDYSTKLTLLKAKALFIAGDLGNTMSILEVPQVHLLAPPPPENSLPVISAKTNLQSPTAKTQTALQTAIQSSPHPNATTAEPALNSKVKTNSPLPTPPPTPSQPQQQSQQLSKKQQKAALKATNSNNNNNNNNSVNQANTKQTEVSKESIISNQNNNKNNKSNNNNNNNNNISNNNNNNKVNPNPKPNIDFLTNVKESLAAGAGKSLEPKVPEKKLEIAPSVHSVTEKEDSKPLETEKNPIIQPNVITAAKKESSLNESESDDESSESASGSESDSESSSGSESRSSRGSSKSGKNQAKPLNKLAEGNKKESSIPSILNLQTQPMEIADSQETVLEVEVLEKPILTTKKLADAPPVTTVINTLPPATIIAKSTEPTETRTRSNSSSSSGSSSSGSSSSGSSRSGSGSDSQSDSEVSDSDSSSSSSGSASSKSSASSRSGSSSSSVTVVKVPNNKPKPAGNVTDKVSNLVLSNQTSVKKVDSIAMPPFSANEPPKALKSLLIGNIHKSPSHFLPPQHRVASIPVKSRSQITDDRSHGESDEESSGSSSIDSEADLAKKSSTKVGNDEDDDIGELRKILPTNHNNAPVRRLRSNSKLEDEKKNIFGLNNTGKTPIEKGRKNNKKKVENKSLRELMGEENTEVEKDEKTEISAAAKTAFDKLQEHQDIEEEKVIFQRPAPPPPPTPSPVREEREREKTQAELEKKKKKEAISQPTSKKPVTAVTRKRNAGKAELVDPKEALAEETRKAEAPNTKTTRSSGKTPVITKATSSTTNKKQKLNPE